MKLLDVISRTLFRRPAAAPTSGSKVQIRTVDQARFRLAPGERRDRLGDGLELTLSFSCMRSEEGTHSVEVRIRDEGLDVQSVVEVNDHRVLVYLGNYFVVPERLQRAGLATACVAAIRQAAQLAVFGQVRHDQRMVLEGYFVGSGEAWALALCGGQLPTKACPAEVRLERLRAVEARLTLLEPPIAHLWTGAASGAA